MFAGFFRRSLFINYDAIEKASFSLFNMFFNTPSACGGAKGCVIIRLRRGASLRIEFLIAIKLSDFGYQKSWDN